MTLISLGVHKFFTYHGLPLKTFKLFRDGYHDLTDLNLPLHSVVAFLLQMAWNFLIAGLCVFYLEFLLFSSFFVSLPPSLDCTCKQANIYAFPFPPFNWRAWQPTGQSTPRHQLLLALKSRACEAGGWERKQSQSARGETEAVPAGFLEVLSLQRLSVTCFSCYTLCEPTHKTSLKYDCKLFWRSPEFQTNVSSRTANHWLSKSQQCGFDR